jgi:hypothetical protein
MLAPSGSLLHDECLLSAMISMFLEERTKNRQLEQKYREDSTN